MRRRSKLRRKKTRGFSLVIMGVCGTVMFGMLGLTTDLGRVYIAKNELQTFADAASIAGALKLDGTSAGLNKADSAAATGPTGPSGAVNGWYFSTQTVASPTISYATT